jgi:hypothetical protein
MCYSGDVFQWDHRVGVKWVRNECEYEWNQRERLLWKFIVIQSDMNDSYLLHINRTEIKTYAQSKLLSDTKKH